MSRLPQPGDAVKATQVLNGRLAAGVGVTEQDVIVRTGSVELTEHGMTGPGVPALLAIYGDLFNVTETLDDAGFAGLVEAHVREVEAGDDTLNDAMCAVALQAVAHGVLQERLRWERGS